MKNKKGIVALSIGLLGLAGAPALFAQDGGLKREMLQRADISAPGREAVVARVEVAPGAVAARHSHHGEEISYVTEGEVELQIDGEAPRVYKAGESFIVPAGKIHGARNSGAAPVKLIGVYVVEKGKPLAVPAP